MNENLKIDPIVESLFPANKNILLDEDVVIYDAYKRVNFSDILKINILATNKIRFFKNSFTEIFLRHDESNFSPIRSYVTFRSLCNIAGVDLTIDPFKIRKISADPADPFYFYDTNIKPNLNNVHYIDTYLNLVSKYQLPELELEKIFLSVAKLKDLKLNQYKMHTGETIYLCLIKIQFLVSKVYPHLYDVVILDSTSKSKNLNPPPDEFDLPLLDFATE